MQTFEFIIVDVYGKEVMFKACSAQTMKTVIDAYKSQRGINKHVYLVRNDRQVTEFDTPESMGLRRWEKISAYIVNDGDSSKDFLDVKIEFSDGMGSVRVYSGTTVENVIDTIRKKYLCHNAKPFELSWKDKTLISNDTMKDLNIKHGDILSIKFH